MSIDRLLNSEDRSPTTAYTQSERQAAEAAEHIPAIDSSTPTSNNSPAHEGSTTSTRAPNSPPWTPSPDRGSSHSSTPSSGGESEYLPSPPRKKPRRRRRPRPKKTRSPPRSSTHEGSPSPAPTSPSPPPAPATSGAPVPTASTSSSEDEGDLPEKLLIRCPHCHVTFTTAAGAYKHIRQSHVDSEFGKAPPGSYDVATVCPFCERVFLSREATRSHIIRNHPDQPAPTPRKIWRMGRLDPSFPGPVAYTVCHPDAVGAVSLLAVARAIEARNQPPAALEDQPQDGETADGPQAEAVTSPGTAIPQQQSDPSQQSRAKPRKPCPHCGQSMASNATLRHHVKTQHKGSTYFADKPRSPPWNTKRLPDDSEFRIVCPHCTKTYKQVESCRMHVVKEHKEGFFGLPGPAGSRKWPHFEITNPGFYPFNLRPIEGESQTSVMLPRLSSRRTQQVEQEQSRPCDGSSLEQAAGASNPAPASESPPHTVLRLRGGAGGSPPPWSPPPAGSPPPPGSPPREVLRLRGGAGGSPPPPTQSGSSGQRSTPSIVCALCSVTITNPAVVGHFENVHGGEMVTPEQVAAMGVIQCACGKIVKAAAGFTSHCKKCPRATVAAVPTAIPRPGRGRQQTGNRSSRPPSRAESVASDGPSTQRPATQPPRQSGLRREIAPTRQSAARQPASEPVDTIDAGQDMGVTETLSLLACLPTTYKFLPAGLIKPFIKRCGELAQSFLDDPSEETIRTIFLFIKVGLAPGLRHRCASQRMASYPNVSRPEPERSTRAVTSPAKAAQKLVETGRLSDALSAAENKNKVVTPTPAVIDELRAKHPPADPPRHQQPLQPQGPPPEGPSSEDILECLKTFKKDSSPGLSGWTVNLLTLAAKDERFVRFLVRLSGMMLDNTAPGKQLLLAARLTPLLKPDGGTRPIAVGDLLYRLCAKALLRKIFKKEHLADFQLGVHSPGGVEPVIHAAQGALDNSFPHRYEYYVSIDFQNCYNNHSRHEQSDGVYEFAPEAWLLYQWTYGETTHLVVRTEDGTEHIDSAQGSRQGCPLGGYFFCVGSRRDMQAVVDELGPGHLTLGFMDDYSFLAPNDRVVETVKRVLSDRKSSLVLNESKCHTKRLETIREEGIELLGSVVGPPEVRRAFIERATEDFKTTMETLTQMPSQHALLILRSCLLPRLRHLLRTISPDGTKDAWAKLDDHVKAAVTALRWAPGRVADDDVDHALISLPVRLGGLGLLSYVDTHQHAAEAAAESSNTLLAVTEVTATVPYMYQRPRV